MSKEFFLSWIGSLLLRLYTLTLRLEICDHAAVPRQPGEPPVLWVFWHNRMLLIPVLYRRLCPKRRGVVLTSASRDGQILAAFVRRFGFEAARGSTSRRGMRALLELTRRVQSGYDVGITPDGPRGPRYRLGPGVMLLARRTGAPIVAASLNYSNFWTLKSWDRFMIPKPFSRVTLELAPRFMVPPETSSDQLESLREEVEKILNDGRRDSI